MPYIRIPGVEGLVWDPEPVPASLKKHDCKDCFSCQWCSDECCEMCLGSKKEVCKKTNPKAGLHHPESATGR